MNVGFVWNAMPSSLVLIMFSKAKMDAAIQFHPKKFSKEIGCFVQLRSTGRSQLQVLVSFCACLSVL
jgi:hypothetical protein